MEVEAQPRSADGRGVSADALTNVPGVAGPVGILGVAAFEEAPPAPEVGTLVWGIDTGPGVRGLVVSANRTPVPSGALCIICTARSIFTLDAVALFYVPGAVARLLQRRPDRLN